MDGVRIAKFITKLIEPSHKSLSGRTKKVSYFAAIRSPPTLGASESVSFYLVPSPFYDGGNDLVQKHESFHLFDDEVENGKNAEILNPGPLEQLRDSGSVRDAFLRKPEMNVEDETPIGTGNGEGS